MGDDRYSGLEFLEEPSSLEISRRHFFKIAGSGIIVYFTVSDSVLAQERQATRLPSDFNAFLKIGEDGRVACYVGKIEMGQGAFTSLAQELADELDVPLDSVDMVMGDTELCPWDMGTFGSLSTRVFGQTLRKAAAEARQTLLELGSVQLKTDVGGLMTEDGFVVEKANKLHRISYAQLTKGKKIERRPTGKVTLKQHADFKIMSMAMLRRDAQEKVTGKAKYAADIHLPGMLYAKILRPPAHDAKLIEADLSDAKQIKDIQIVKEGDFVAVLHKYPDVAEEALSKIKARFTQPKSEPNDMDIFDHLLRVAPEGKVVTKGGDLATGERAATTSVEETYLNDYVAHATMEPHAALATIEGEKVTAWVSTQNPFTCRDEIAKVLGVPPEKVRVITPFVGGGFGGKTRNLQAVEAARLAKLTGKPVQVAYTRKEEFFFDAFRPAAVVKIRSGVAGTGKIGLWDYKVYFAGERGAQHFYDIPNHVTTAYNSSWVGAAGSHPFATGPWRAPGNNTNTFARESQIDGMAAKAGIDPVEFRLQNLSDKRMIRVLKTAAEKAGWKSGKAPTHSGRGIACGIDAGTYVASIAEVEVDRATGNIEVKRVVCAQDMGLVINPAGATIQMEGCIMMGMGYALTERVRFKGSDILDANFDTYQIPRFSWLPKIETFLIDNKEMDPQGGGEPAIVTMGAVIANAIYDAVGIRMLQLPMTPERIKEAFKKG